MTRSRLLALASHAACLAAGWWVSHGVVASRQESGVKEAETRSRRAVAADAESLLDSVLGAEGSFERLRTSQTPPADFKAALDAAVRKWVQDPHEARSFSPEMAALLHQWMARDLTAAFEWGKTSREAYWALQMHVEKALGALLKEHGWQAGRELFATSWLGMAEVDAALGKAFAATGDAAAFADLKDSSRDDHFSGFRYQMMRHWSQERREELLKLALAENVPSMLMGLGQGEQVLSVETIRWLQALGEREDLPEAFKATLARSSFWQWAAMRQRELPFAERVAFESSSPDMIANIDVDMVLTEGRDWRHALRHGEATVEEIRDAVFAQLGTTAAAAPEELRKHLYYQLAEEDPEAARRLLEDLPAEERNRITLECAKIAFKNVEPDRFLAALQDLPADTPELWENRLEAWKSNAAWNQRRLNEDYVNWVRALPTGLDREMAMFSLAYAMREKQPGLARELGTELQDPKLRERLEGSARQ